MIDATKSICEIEERIKFLLFTHECQISFLIKDAVLQDNVWPRTGYEFAMKVSY
jgi:hypothetical protein